jgi:hypothetical protein
MSRRYFQHSFFLLICWAGISLGFGVDLATETGRSQHAMEMKEGLTLFKNQVRGILETNCLECHGGEEIEADFDMSTRESLYRSGVVAGSSEDSDLVDAITHRFEPFMPHERDKLSDEEIQAISRWIDLGAPYDKPLSNGSEANRDGPLIVTDEDRDYWAYRVLSKPEVPVADDKFWPRTEIDHFILEELQENGLRPNEEAKRRTQIRRAYLNAIGLPPTTDEVAEFVNDFKTKAYERMIDRMLESPHYGETWARHWMDIARFAESTGFEIDFDRPYAYLYRDFLIKAFNQNMPYDQFVRWQIAGDELRPEDPLALMATGFLGAGAFSSVITEKEFESARYDELDDMINTLGTAMLGTTIGCARCHDHKYDPIPTKDYYQFAANFTRTVRSYVNYDPEKRSYELTKKQWSLDGQKLATDLMKYEETILEEPFRNWMEKGSFEIPLERWIVLSPETFSSNKDTILEKLWDDSVLLTGPNPELETETVFFECETRLLNISGLRMETLTHPSLPNNGPGRDHEGGFCVREITVQVKESGTRDAKWEQVELKSAEATAQENEASFGAGAAINRVSQGWSVDLDSLGKDQALVIRFAEPVGFKAGSRLKITVSSGFNLQQMVGRPRFSITIDPRAPVELSEGIPISAYHALLKLLVGWPPTSLSEEETVAFRRWFGRNNDGWLSRRDKWIEHQLSWPKSTETRIMVSSDSLPPVWHRSANKGFPSFYESTHLLKRGDVTQKGEVMTPGLLQVLQPVKHSATASKTPRSAVVDWLTDVEHGAGALLARVFVNRVWHYHFGRGIVATPSDFGTQGGDPSHPELLEWLARDFVDHGWDVKRLQKQVMNSAVYRQASDLELSKSAVDVENKLFWRFPSRRVEAEVVRDSLLHVSGLLDPTQFGPGTRNPEMRRRSIYFFIKRSALIPEMTLFDWPEHLVGIGHRVSTTIAPQALQFLNSPQTRKYAEGVSNRLINEGDLEALIKHAYQLVLNRFPKLEETKIGVEFIEAQQASYRNQGYDEGLALVDFCQSLLSLNEFLYIR